VKCRLWITGQLEVVAGDFDDDSEEDFESDEGLSLDELDFSDFSEGLDFSLELELSELAPSELDDELALEELLVIELLAASRLSLR
jgi:hypothetical protein